MFCAFSALNGALTLLLHAGLDPNLRNNKGNTALHIACQRGHLETAKLLVKFGARAKENLNKQKPQQLIPKNLLQSFRKLFSN